MTTAFSSIITAVVIWYFLIGVYNISYLAISKKLNEIVWTNFLLTNLIILALYSLANFIAIAFFSGNFILFGVTNVILVFGAGYLGGSFILKKDFKKALLYAAIFTIFLNLLWYKLIGII